MKKRFSTIAIILLFLLASCNLNSTTATLAPDTEEPTHTVILPSDTPAVPPTDTIVPTPSDTPTITPTLTPSVAMVTPTTEGVNCRFGPGTNYISIGGLKAGTSAALQGQNGDGTWWQIINPNDISTKCWLAASATTVSGNMASVPVQPAPQALVTTVTVTNPDTISVPGCIGPIQPIRLVGTIDVNGPTPVTWHFETQQGGALPDHTLVFDKYGPLSVLETSYTPPLVAGTYWVKLFITAPNSVTAQGTYTIACP